jgi:membrane complex biogenesis BtpA family protein
VLTDLFGVSHPVIAMAHFPPLPGTPLHDEKLGMRGALDAVARDVRILEDAGFDAVLFCNEGDRLYAFQAGPEIAAAMGWIIARAAPRAIPFGVDHLYDIRTALGVAHATGAAFVRGVFSGAYESDMGLWSADLPGLLRYRRAIGAGALKLFMNVTPEFASSIGQRPVGALAKSAVVNGLADAILIAGPLAGAAVDLAPLEEARAALGDMAPVIVTTGVTHDSLPRYLTRFDGVIVGTSLKVDGYTWNPVDPERAKRFMDRARALRAS